MNEGDRLSRSATPDFLDRIRSRTPARVLAGSAGAGYRTPTQLDLRQAHAAARDAVRTELDLERDLGAECIRRWQLFEVWTRSRSKDEYLLRPDLGRQLREDAVRTIEARCPAGADLEIVIGDGLSVTAVSAQVPGLLPLIVQRANDRGWRVGQTFAVRYCRVGVMNHIGDLLAPKVVALLIGERPGLATAESLSAYMAYRPRTGHTDAQRNLISNIHARGVTPEAAAERIVNLASQMMTCERSGVEVKEELPAQQSALSNQHSAKPVL
jgi:ethanolamine ammonia-lyase small subunit